MSVAYEPRGSFFSKLLFDSLEQCGTWGYGVYLGARSRRFPETQIAANCETKYLNFL